MVEGFDEGTHEFKCSAPQCRHVFKKTYRSLLNADEVVCPKCLRSQDIREAKRSGELGSRLAELGSQGTPTQTDD